MSYLNKLFSQLKQIDIATEALQTVAQLGDDYTVQLKVVLKSDFFYLNAIPALR